MRRQILVWIEQTNDEKKSRIQNIFPLKQKYTILPRSQLQNEIGYKNHFLNKSTEYLVCKQKNTESEVFEIV